ncbi:uncharacterized protein E0L32_002357 [Thyridium curvatum]|uniref:Alpha/beta hydrolase fold-3 domain-containing protein n=1 Tax=Thyridium curvatum TaxID=1093900 RepID=A0A507APU5_9PEZI|nr:uncharacterized protein E0L32_002357 [Thyridium curvatum]TPX06861.1 hypothetical protein E0L32_002357 [Thyridium curvatum]
MTTGDDPAAPKPTLPDNTDNTNKDGLPRDVRDEYVNPLEQSARWYLATQAYGLRSGAGLAFGISGRYSPSPPSPARTIYLDATLGRCKEKGAIRVDVYAPRGHFRSSGSGSGSGNGTANGKNGSRAGSKRGSAASSRVDLVRQQDGGTLSRTASESTVQSAVSEGAADLSTRSTKQRRKRLKRHLSRTVSAMSFSSVEFQQDEAATVDAMLPVPRLGVINFHGGGFILGNGTDDARWAAAAVAQLDAVVFSVNYRLAPSYPYPTPVEDCADAILQIAQRADELGVDAERLVVSGFSAGGTLSLASWCLLQDPRRWGYELPRPAPALAGFALYYPLLDWTVSRPDKRLGCARPDLTLPKGMTDLFDASYLHPPIPRERRDDPRLSPGLMPDAMLERLPPVHLCLCEFDMLLAEGRRFAERLRARGRPVELRVVEREKHAWDKPPPMAPKRSADVEYRAAIETIQAWVASRADDGEDDDDPEIRAALTT